MADPLRRVPAPTSRRSSGATLQRARATGVSDPADASEREADRVADAAVAGARSPGRHAISSVAVSHVQRQEASEKTNEEKYAEAAKKAGEAFMETPVGKNVKKKVLADPLVAGAKEAGESFIGTLPGKVITGAAAVGVVGALAATHTPLPVPIPEIPLDRWAPGLKVKLTYEGPVDSPTKAMITFTYSQAGGSRRSATSAAERARQDVARLRAENARFRAGMRHAPGSPEDLQQKEDEAAFRRAMAGRLGRLPSERSSNVQAGPGLSTTQLPITQLGFKPKPLTLIDEELQLKPLSDVTPIATERKEDEEQPDVMRKAAVEGPATATWPMAAGIPRDSGSSLDAAIRVPMEERLGQDFGDVRIHTDALASSSATSVHATAYTVGRDIVFASGAYSPKTIEGRRLIAHELTHVVQQRATTVPSILQRKGGSIGGFFANIGRAIASVFVDEPGFSDVTLQRYLAVLDAGAIEDDYDSDDRARIVVRRWMAGPSGYALSKERKALLLKEMISGFTGDADEAAMLDLLTGSPDDELTYIFGRVPPSALRADIHGEERAQLERVLAGLAARTGPTAASNAFAGTHAVTPTEKGFVEGTLTPGATIAPAPIVPQGVQPPPPAVVPPPAMTGLPPAPNVPGAFETAMTAAMTTYLAGHGAAFRALKAAGPAAFPIAGANSIAISAQQQTEAHFAPYLRVASHAPSDKYHPGSYSLTSMLRDQSTVPITDLGTVAGPGGPARPGRVQWMRYWMQQDSSGAKAVMTTFSCVPSLRPADQAEFDRVRHKLAKDPALKADIDDTIHGWPAEASAGVNIQPYQTGTSAHDMRVNRWDVFTTLIHELMHIVQHPNYERTYKLIGGDAMEILKEGMADVMRHDLWDGPGQLKTRLATTAYAPVRRQVEGADLPYDASAVHYHVDYPGKYPKARELVDGASGYPGVGIANAKAAFFMGHTELLGLGAGTSTEGGASLAGVASYRATESADAEVVVARAGDTETRIRAMTNTPTGGVLEATTGAPIAAGAGLAVGRRLRVPGIRHTYALREDTLGTIAAQHGVPLADLARANRLPPATPANHKLPAGQRVLIPRRGA